MLRRLKSGEDAFEISPVLKMLMTAELVEQVKGYYEGKTDGAGLKPLESPLPEGLEDANADADAEADADLEDEDDDDEERAE